ncbi:putative permease [Marinitoga piezophila KA3]|uniref:Putative permease n=1 Tax=Marinitoga piezophila (strain DSM 14283 / JCM 11233 / KA3) TaxID=443254 RepID=H2J7Q5_MARPK|nr:AI-2E family transporter [Marinitoga piezophila]AEX85396.1 putative permease [Marinitoga piezophila KA3]
MKKSFWFIMMYLIVFMISLKIFSTIVGSLVIAMFFTILIDVIASYLEKIKIPRKLTVPIASLIFYGAIVYAFYSVIPITIEESKKVFDSIAEFDFQGIPGTTGEVVNTLLDTAGDYLRNMIVQFASYLASNISNFLTIALLLIVASGYMAIASKRMWNLIDMFFPNSEIDSTKDFLIKTYSDLRKFVSGQIITALSVGVITWIMALIFGFPYALFLGILAGITDFIPYLGIFITAIPILLLGFTNFGLMGLLKGVIIITFANQLEMWVLAPRISGGQVNINWFLILTSMLIFAQLYGVVGVLITIPLLIIFKNIWKMYVVDYLKKI